MDEKQLPDGFMFNPTDVELVCYYLRRKLLGKKLFSVVIPEVDVYKFAPWDLPDMAGSKVKHQFKWHFFCPSSKYHHSSGRANRATDIGFWKPTGKDRAVSFKNVVVGMHKTLIFYVGRPPSGERTDWIMHEYRTHEQVSSAKDHEFVLCVIFRKDGKCPKTSHGMEEEEEEAAIIDDDDNDNDNDNDDGFKTSLGMEEEDAIIDDNDIDNGFVSPHNSLEPDQSETTMQLAEPSDLLSPESLSTVERGTSCSETSVGGGVPKSFFYSKSDCDDVALVGSSHRQHQYSVSKSFKDDGFSWRKYGQKTIPGAKYPRWYYRCISGKLKRCPVSKTVQISDEENDVFVATYRGVHTCNFARTTHHLLPHPSKPEIQEQMSSSSSINFSEPATPQEIIECYDLLDTSQKTTAVPSFNSLIHFHSFSPPFKSPSTSAADDSFFGDGYESYGNPDSELNNIINGCLSSLAALDLSNCKRIQNLPKGILRLKSVQTLSISGCSMLMEQASAPDGMLIENQVNLRAHASDEEVSMSYLPLDNYVPKFHLQQPEEERIISNYNSTASKDAAEPSSTTGDLELHKEVLKAYMNMPVEKIHQANAFYDVHRTVDSLIRQIPDLHESASLHDLTYCLEELQENVPETMSHMHDARVSKASIQVKLAHLHSSFVQSEGHYNGLAARLSVISDEEEDLDAETDRLLAKRRELLD